MSVFLRFQKLAMRMDLFFSLVNLLVSIIIVTDCVLNIKNAFIPRARELAEN